ncbi:Uncharacterised protein [Enterobacter cloacae]|nr:Uncharacterised protein [Enterobacter cloacae]
MNVVDHFLQGPETHGDAFRQHHLHQVLLNRIVCNLVICHQHQVRPRKPHPLYAHLTVDQAFINAA